VISLIVFVIDCFVSPFVWEDGPFDHVKSKIWRVSFNVLFAVVAGVLLAFAFPTIVSILNDFVRAQSH
jgi:hypothetical protein